MSSERQRRARSGRRAFLKTSASAGVGLAVGDRAAAQSARPRDLGLPRMTLIDLSVALEHDAAGERTKPRIEYVTHEAAASRA